MAVDHVVDALRAVLTRAQVAVGVAVVGVLPALRALTGRGLTGHGHHHPDDFLAALFWALALASWRMSVSRTVRSALSSAARRDSI